jgi:translation initiation factor IF-3
MPLNPLVQGYFVFWWRIRFPSSRPSFNKEKMINTQPRMNGQIRISPVRVVSEDGEMLGEMETVEALRMAADAGLDLVEVGANARPPVCRIMDYGKLQYERSKKQSSGPKKHRTQLKQIRLRAKTGQHDIDFKVRQARGFLERRDKVKVNVMFRGRENAHHDRGREMLDEIIKTLEDVAEVERPPMMEGRRMMTMMLTPKAK